MTSHTFIRREILALEAGGDEVSRFTIRRPRPGDLVDAADLEEQSRTRAVLDVGVVGLLIGLIRAAATGPVAFSRALWICLRLGRRSERGLMLHLAYLAEACVLRGWLAAGGVEHLHAHFGTNPAAVAMLVRALGGPPFSFTVHGPTEFDSPVALSLGEKISRAAFVVAISEFGRSQLYRWSAHSDWPKIRIVRCAVDGDFLSPPPRPPSTAPRLVCVGRLVEQKGQLLLVEAAARLRDRGIAFELVLVGDGPMRGEIEDLIARLALSREVRVVGWKDGAGVRGEILAARALVLPSFAEGLPVVFMEAMALGRPVIGTYIAGIPELVRPGISGWLVPPGSVERLVDALAEALMTSEVELESMGKAGAALVRERHNSVSEAVKLQELFCSSHVDSAVPTADSTRPSACGRSMT
jgi:glycosyltransferase involved in cell wall biosynthesis